MQWYIVASELPVLWDDSPRWNKKTQIRKNTKGAGQCTCKSRLSHDFFLAPGLSLRQKHGACPGHVRNRNKKTQTTKAKITATRRLVNNILQSEQRLSSIEASDKKNDPDIFAGPVSSVFAFFYSIGGLRRRRTTKLQGQLCHPTVSVTVSTFLP